MSGKGGMTVKKPKLIEVEKLYPLNRRKDGGFLLLYRQAVCMTIEQNRRNQNKDTKIEEKP